MSQLGSARLKNFIAQLELENSSLGSSLPVSMVWVSMGYFNFKLALDSEFADLVLFLNHQFQIFQHMSTNQTSFFSKAGQKSGGSQ